MKDKCRPKVALTEGNVQPDKCLKRLDEEMDSLAGSIRRCRSESSLSGKNAVTHIQSVKCLFGLTKR